MKVFVAGKITGLPNYKEYFQNAETLIKKLCPDACVLLPSILPAGMSYADYEHIDRAMIDVADLVVFLPSYIVSPGASIELDICRYIQKPYIIMQDMNSKTYQDALKETLRRCTEC